MLKPCRSVCSKRKELKRQKKWKRIFCFLNFKRDSLFLSLSLSFFLSFFSNSLYLLHLFSFTSSITHSQPYFLSYSLSLSLSLSLTHVPTRSFTHKHTYLYIKWAHSLSPPDCLSSFFLSQLFSVSLHKNNATPAPGPLRPSESIFMLLFHRKSSALGVAIGRSNFSFFDIVVMLSSDSGTFAATNAGSVVARCGRSSYGDEGGDVKMRGRNTFRCSFSELVSQCV